MTNFTDNYSNLKSDKKNYMKKSWILTSAALALAENAMAQKQPNIIVIFADDMGYGDVSYAGELSKICTENIDRLAHEGAVFTDAHTSSSVSTPSRYALLTGRYNWRSSLKRSVLNGYSKSLIKPDRETVASMLRRQGYTTAGFGKWHLGWDWSNIENGEQKVDFAQPIQNGPTTRGFDYWYGISASLDMPPYVYVENDRVTALPNRITESKGMGFWRKGPTGADFVHEEVLPNLTQRACRYIAEKAKSDQPYFLYFPLPAPHTPILPTKEFQGKSGLNPYGDFVLMVDDAVGRVMQAVGASGEAKNTIVIFTTDNGCSPQARLNELQKKGHYPNHIFRGMKSDIFEGGHRVPLVVHWPKKVKPHQVDQTVCLTDLYATLADISGYELKDSEGEDSYSLLPALRSTKPVKTIREATVHHSIDGDFSIRQGKWKLVLTASSGGWSYPQNESEKVRTGKLPAVQLYDLEADPKEQKNVKNKNPEVAKQLARLFFKYVRDGRSTPGVTQPNETDASNKGWRQLQDAVYAALKAKI